LSVHRAFVVHLGAGGSGRRRVSGRVEHLSSGRTAHFDSLKGLPAFFAAILDAADDGAKPGPPEDRRSAPASDRPWRRRTQTQRTSATAR
jgi:hypothetical protein